MQNSIPYTVHDNLLTFRDSGKQIDIKYLLIMITHKNYYVQLASLSDKKVIYEYAKEKNFDIKAQRIQST